MKAKCIENNPRNIRSSIVSTVAGQGVSGSEGVYDLTIGLKYPIVGMQIWKNTLTLLTMDDWGTPCSAHAGFFAEFTGSIPSGWFFRLGSGACATEAELWEYPETATCGYTEYVCEDNYVARLYDGDTRALEIFMSHVY